MFRMSLWMFYMSCVQGIVVPNPGHSARKEPNVTLEDSDPLSGWLSGLASSYVNISTTANAVLESFVQNDSEDVTGSVSFTHTHTQKILGSGMDHESGETSETCAIKGCLRGSCFVGTWYIFCRDLGIMTTVRKLSNASVVDRRDPLHPRRNVPEAFVNIKTGEPRVVGYGETGYNLGTALCRKSKDQEPIAEGDSCDGKQKGFNGYETTCKHPCIWEGMVRMKMWKSTRREKHYCCQTDSHGNPVSSCAKEFCANTVYKHSKSGALFLGTKTSEQCKRLHNAQSSTTCVQNKCCCDMCEMMKRSQDDCKNNCAAKFDDSSGKYESESDPPPGSCCTELT